MNKIGRVTIVPGVTRAFAQVDSKLRNYYFSVIAALALFVAIHFLRVSYQLADVWNGWTIGDWLINYDKGFVRRGLPGMLFVKINEWSHLPINWIIYWTQAFVFVLFLILFLALISKRKLTGAYLLLCLSPATLLFTYYDGMAVGRKEILLYFCYVSWLLINRSRTPTYKENLTYAALGFLLTLVHELFFFYSIYFYYSYKKPFLNRESSYLPALLIPLSSLLAIVCLMLWGGVFDTKLMCADFMNHGATENICEGIISYGSNDLTMVFKDFVQNIHPKIMFEGLALIVLLICPYYYFFRIALVSTNKCKGLRWQYFYVIGMTLPLFILSIDWGRWIAIHATLSLMYASTLLSKKNEPAAGGCASNQANKNIKQNFVLSLSIILGTYFTFDLSYSLRHCCQNNFFVIGGPLIKLKSTIESNLNIYR